MAYIILTIILMIVRMIVRIILILPINYLVLNANVSATNINLIIIFTDNMNAKY